MPFENSPTAPRNIAVVGAGISGLGAAFMLSNEHRVTLFEAGPRLGGHARTKIAGRHGDQPVDTGFIVFNYANYPHLTALFDQLDVPVVESNMSFAASLQDGAFEYGLANFGAIFAQKRNILDPRYWRMLRDVLRFNSHALDAANDPTQSLGDFLDSMGLGEWFRRYYLLPLSGAIWSTPTQKILDFPAYALVRFFENHALLHHSGQHQWFTVKGGSAEYVARVEAAMRQRGVDIRLDAPVKGLRRHPVGVEICTTGGSWEHFDDVVMATHSDDTLSMLSDPSPEEQSGLSAVRYQSNEVVLHADDTVMPKRKQCWSSWNYTEDSGVNPELNTIDLTYWMNRLQPIPKDDPMFVTLNSRRTIRQELIYDSTVLRHPVYDLEALEGQKLIASINGARNTWFCGAWMKNGFHEDGLSSAVDVVEAIRNRSALTEAA